MAAALALPARAGDGEAFVNAFAAATAPERLRVPGTVARVIAFGRTGKDRGTGPEDAPWLFIGCHRYDFAATEPVGPGAVSKLVEKPVARALSAGGITGYVWGPSCAMPRTGDIHLSFVADGSAAAELTGFSGLMLKLETSEPGPGDVIPETYC